MRRDSGLGEGVTHSSSFLDFVGDTVNEAEFRGEVEVLVLVLNEEEGLLHVSDHHVVMALEILSHADLLALEIELHCDWVQAELDVSDNVSASVAPVSNDTLARVLKLHHLLPVVLVLGVPLHLLDLL